MTPPDLIGFSGDWPTYLDRIYQQYHSEIIATPISLWGNSINVRWVPESHGKPFNFWHLISEGSEEDERTPDLDRCARISWIAWVIASCDQNLDCVSWYLSERTTPRGRKVNMVLWAHDHDYVVILEPKKGHAMLVSAYPLRSRRVEKTQREFDAFQRNPTAIPHW